MIDWHHLFEWTLVDYFTGSNYRVDLEKDISVKPQRLDVLLIEKSTGTLLTEVPDGLENLSRHNLLTYKSLRETLDTLVIYELVSYYVNYRKLLDHKKWDELPNSEFQLYAVTTRYPRKFSKEFETQLEKQKAGVYDLKHGNHTIRVIVLSEIQKTPKNAVWQLFSSQAKGFDFGSEHYQWRYPPAIALLNPLFKLYRQEGINMSYTIEQAYRECVRDTLESLPPEERLRGMPLPEIINYFSPAEVIKQLSPAEVVKQLSLDDIFQQFSKEEIEEHLAKLKQ
ncbi:MAG: hypothetical protein DRR08_13445 [Candidatus Parabeggiatoa sp. nov. 2]|nr:MAG: hypothetical protein B6247_06540 [Beggiatoa sp. 4572_84]RKZ59635.1 MAG: hypothetical protein DRR08_13445 [Gammaproteobacteria bacterium]HEC85026.1 hypothetical protein [Thioploca sp.]